MSGETCFPGGSATDDAIPSFACGRSASDRPGRPGGGRARGHDDVGRAHHAGVPLARSRGDRGHYHAVHGALRAARRAREAHAGGDQQPEPGRVVDPVEGWARVRIRAPQGDDFHNGEPITAEDVKFSFDRYRGSGAKLLKERVREVQIVDPDRVRFLLKEPWPDFMTFYGTSATGSGWIVPKKYLEKVGDDGFKKAPVGAGPYRFVSFNPGVELVLEAYEGYWRKTPIIKRLVLRSIPEETTRAAALKAGEVDIAYLLSGPVAEDIQRTPGFKLVAPKESPAVFWFDL